MLNYLKSLKNEDGQDLLEYALLVALIALVAVGAVTAAGTQVQRDLQPDRGGHLTRDEHSARPGRRVCRPASGASASAAPQEQRVSDMKNIVSFVAHDGPGPMTARICSNTRCSAR